MLKISLKIGNINNDNKPSKIKYLWQRAKRGYSDEDLYSIDNYFLKTIVPMLEWLKDNKHGVPYEFTIDEQGHEIDIDLADQHWKAELSKMIDHFKAINLYHDTQNNEKHIQEGFKLFAKYFTNLWD